MNTVTREHLAGLELFAKLHDNDLDFMLSEDLARLIAQASAAPEQEPVAWLYSRPEGRVTPVVLLEKASDRDRGSWDETPLYTHPSAALERLRALSVENIMIDVLPGPDGMGVEVYAKSVADVDAAFGRMVDREEELEQNLAKAQAMLRDFRDAVNTSDVATRSTSARKRLYSCIDRADAFLSATAQPAEDQNDE